MTTKLLNKVSFLSLILAINIIAGTGYADTQRILAVVGDEVITSHELKERMKLSAVTSGVPDNIPLKEISEITLDELVQEKLKIYKAKDLNITASEKDIDNAIVLLERQNKLPAGGLKIAMKQSGIDYGYVRDKVAAEIIWNKLVSREVGNTIKLNDEELNKFIENKELEKNKFDISEIILPFNRNSESSKAKQEGEEILRRIRAGASFEEMAKQYSKGPSSIAGGRVGWVLPASLPDNVKKVVEASATNDINMILMPDSYIIVKTNKVIETDPTELFSEWYVKSLKINNPDIKTRAGAAKLNKQISTIANGNPTCDNLQTISKSVGAEYKDYGYKKISSLTGALKNIIPMLAIGELSQPVRGKDSISFYLACDKEELSYNEQYEMKKRMAGKVLKSKRVEEASAQLIEDLKKETIIDIRL